MQIAFLQRAVGKFVSQADAFKAWEWFSDGYNDSTSTQDSK
jgi:hypothetical protein